MKVRFRTEAAEDVLSARAWYDAQRQGLGDEFVTALERVLELMVELPDAFPEIGAGHRRALVGRFPYAIYYRIEGDILDVVACLHTRRAPRGWHR